MLLNEDGIEQSRHQYVSSIDDRSQKYIKPLVLNWLEAAIWAYSNNRDDFQIRDIVGYGNTNWKYTPLQEIYNYHRRRNLTDEQAMNLAGQDVGRIAKRVMYESNHNYQVLSITRGYRDSKVYKRLKDTE